MEDRLALHGHHPWFVWRMGEGFSRSERLKSDLLALGEAPSDIAPVGRPDVLLPELDRPAAALGCAWVAEGSAMGGRRMAQSLRRMAWLELTMCTFLTEEGKQIARWQACCEAVEDCGADTDRRHEMGVAALAVFGMFQTLLMGDP